MSIPAHEVRVPARARALAQGAALTPVWENAIGGLTFRTDDGRFIKVGPRHRETSMREEAARMRWASSWTRVPAVLAQGEDDTEEWLVTGALPGLSAVDPRWIARPEIAVPAAARALRALHEALPVSECPWSWGVPERIANAALRGVVVPESLHEAPPIDRLVVCHGDACVPNTLLDEDGERIAHVDLGALGTADRWADLSVASMSTVWNYGPGFEDLFIEAYGVTPDRARIAYYRGLWDAT